MVYLKIIILWFSLGLALYGDKFIQKDFPIWKGIFLLIALASSLSFLFLSHIEYFGRENSYETNQALS